MATSAKKVLLLGAGMVSDPLAHYFSLQGGEKVSLTVASNSGKDCQRLASIGSNIDAITVDIQKEPNVIDDLISYVSLIS